MPQEVTLVPAGLTAQVGPSWAQASSTVETGLASLDLQHLVFSVEPEGVVPPAQSPADSPSSRAAGTHRRLSPPQPSPHRSRRQQLNKERTALPEPWPLDGFRGFGKQGCPLERAH